MPAKKFVVPFASTGNKTAVPNTLQPDGTVSYAQGFGPDYELDKTVDPVNAKDVPRAQTNQIYYDLTDAVGEQQLYGVALWGADRAPYPLNARAYHTGKLWRSNAANNNGEPGVSVTWDDVSAQSPDYLNTTRIDVASAATVNLTSSAPNTRSVNITGTTAITAFTVAAGQLYFVRFAGVLTLTNNASIVTQSGANITTAAGDTCILRATAANVVEVLCYTSGVVTGTGSNVLSASPALTGNPTAPTAAQFDNDTSIATTEFVQRALGNRRTPVASNVSRVLTAGEAGAAVLMSGTATECTLPPLSEVPIGSTFTIFTTCPVMSVRTTAPNNIIMDANTALQTVVIGNGDSLEVVASPTAWIVVGGTAKLQHSYSFAKSFAGNGWQKLPSGLIIQWGSFSVGVTSYSFPIAFPTAFVSISQMQGGETSGTIGRIALASTPTTSGFTTSSVVSNKLPAYWTAIGY